MIETNSLNDLKKQWKESDMTRKEETKIATEFEKGVEWADEHPKLVTIPLEEIENVAKEIIDKDWQVQQDKLWAMIERNLLAKFIEKACKWLKEQSCCGYIEDTDVDEFIKQFKQAMKEE